MKSSKGNYDSKYSNRTAHLQTFLQLQRRIRKRMTKQHPLVAKSINYYNRLNEVSIRSPLTSHKEKLYLTLKIEKNHCQAPLSHSSVEVLRGQLCNGVHIWDKTTTLIHGRSNFIIQLIWWQTQTHDFFFSLTPSLFNMANHSTFSSDYYRYTHHLLPPPPPFLPLYHLSLDLWRSSTPH